MSALLIDVGNTAIKWCIERDGVLGEVTRCERSLADFVESLSVIGTDISQVAIASVAGADFEQQLAQALGDITGAAVAFARTAAAAGPLHNSYAEPERMGVDRWLAMLGAFEPGKGPVCVIDAGTALTVDLVDAQGRHVGGYIIPGIQMMTAALLSQTDRVRFDDQAPTTLKPGQSTAACVTAGGWTAGFGAIQQVMAQHPDYRIVLAGGDASALIALGINGVWYPDLVFEGLRRWLTLNLSDYSPKQGR